MQFFLSASNLIETFAHATIICDSAVVNLVISSSLQGITIIIIITIIVQSFGQWWWWVHCLMKHEELSINKQVPHIVKRIRKIMVSVELCKEIEKDFFFYCRSPHEESNLRPLNSVPQHSTTEPQRLYGEKGTLQSPNMTRISCTMLGSAMLLVSYFVNRIRKMVSVELSNEKEKEVVSSCCEHEIKKKFWDSVLLCFCYC